MATKQKIIPYPTLCKELQDKAKSNEDLFKMQKKLNSLKQWIDEQPHLHARTDGSWLASFLRVNNYELEKTKDTIDLYYTCKTLIPDFLSDRDPLLDKIQEVLKRRAITVLPKTNPAEPTLIFNRAGNMHPSFVSVTEFSKVMLMMFDILCMEDPNASIVGASYIVDLKGFTYRYIPQVTISFTKRIVTFALNAHPFRIKNLYYLNVPFFYKGLYNTFKLFLSEEFTKRIRFYGSIEEFHKDVPLSSLPKDYGGELPSCDEISDEWKIKVESYRDWFINDEKFGTNEANRPGKPKTSKSVFG